MRQSGFFIPILIMAIVVPAGLSAQTPVVVPSEMEFADIRLRITEGAKREIEETVDLLTRSPYHFQLKADRSNLYMHFVEHVLEKEGIPEDFKYLAIQEGEFISDAVSTSNAVGFWQFKKASAQEVGLRIDHVVDERKHIIASTLGATKYFKRSNFVFDNWLLTLQSYLQGLGGTQRSAPDKLYGAKRVEINKKTHWYIKKYLAHKLAFQDFVGRGIKHPEVSLQAYEGKGKTLQQVSRELGIDYNELKRFNKWLKQGRIPDEKSYRVIYPVKNDRQPIAAGPSGESEPAAGTGNTGQEPVRAVAERAQPGRNRYPGVRPLEGNTGIFPLITGNREAEYEPGQIRLNGIPAIRAGAGDDINTLAQRTGLKAARLKQYNDIGPNGNIREGRYYYLRKKRGKGRVHYHIVQPGENLWGISQDYGVRLKGLLRKNRMRKEEPLKAGRVLWLRFIRPDNVPVEYGNVKLAGIGVSAEDRLIQEVAPSFSPPERPASPATLPRSLPGEQDGLEERKEVLLSRKKSELLATEEDTIITHIVRPKESFFAISRQYGIEIDDILDWNDLNIMDGLRIDQSLKLVVPKAYFENLKPDELIHEVQAGDTLWSISRKYGVTVEDLLRWNQKKTDALAPGEHLRIIRYR